MKRLTSLVLVVGALAAPEARGQATADQVAPINEEDVLIAIRDNYPQPLWDIRASGHPVLLVRYDAEGVVDDVKIVEAGGHRLFAEAAMKVAEVMRFEPVVIDGRAQGGEATVPVDFVTPLPPELANLRVCESPPTIVNRNEIAEALRQFYPRVLADAGVGGRVSLLFKIDSQGMVWSIEVEQASEYLELDEAALAVGAFMRFSPGTEDGVPTPSLLRQPVTFGVR